MYTSRKSMALNLFMSLHNRKTKKGFLKKNNNKTEMQAICFEEKQAKAHPSLILKAGELWGE